MKILIINGPNLNLLGKREPDIYGTHTLEDINKEITVFATALRCKAEFFQSNCEGAIIDKIQETNSDGIIINAGAYTHYSYAIRDAVKGSRLPCIEVHMSNVYAREEFRCKSVLAEVCKGMICGFGVDSYKLAMQALCNNIK